MIRSLHFARYRNPLLGLLALLLLAGTSVAPRASPPPRTDPGVARPTPPPLTGITLTPGHFAADLSVMLAADRETSLVGARVTIAVTASNNGPRRDRRVVVSATLPPGLTHVNNDAPDNYNPATGEWLVGALGAGDRRTLRIVATMLGHGQHTQLASVRGANSDPDPGNNIASYTITARPAPNIVVIMLDDLDERSLSDMLTAGLMPVFEARIAARALQFTESFVTNPVCCPSRATFLTGQYSHNHGVITNAMDYPGTGVRGAVGYFDDTVTLATRLQAIGYATGYIGKYLNGYGENKDEAQVAPAFDPAYVPPGWDTWRGLVDPTTFCMYNFKISHDGVVRTYKLPEGESEHSGYYQTHVLARLSAEFVSEKTRQPAPFFLTIMPLAPHIEACASAYPGHPPQTGFHHTLRPAPEDRFVEPPMFSPSQAYDEDTSDKPSWLASLPSLTQAQFDAIAAQYRARLQSLVAVDRLLAHLVTALGPAIDNTVIIFTSDNGWLYGERRSSGKGFAYDESARVPLYVRLPQIAAAVKRSTLVINNDLAPTIVELADPNFDPSGFDGRSLVPLLRASEPFDWTDRQRFLIEHSRINPRGNLAVPGYRAVRTPRTLYIESTTETLVQSPPVELSGLEQYFLDNDPYELWSLLHYPESAPEAALTNWIELLRDCAGQVCRQLEDQPD